MAETDVLTLLKELRDHRENHIHLHYPWSFSPREIDQKIAEHPFIQRLTSCIITVEKLQRIADLAEKFTYPENMSAPRKEMREALKALKEGA